MSCHKEGLKSKHWNFETYKEKNMYDLIRNKLKGVAPLVADLSLCNSNPLQIYFFFIWDPSLPIVVVVQSSNLNDQTSHIKDKF